MKSFYSRLLLIPIIANMILQPVAFARNNGRGLHTPKQQARYARYAQEAKRIRETKTLDRRQFETWRMTRPSRLDPAVTRILLSSTLEPVPVKNMSEAIEVSLNAKWAAIKAGKGALRTGHGLTVSAGHAIQSYFILYIFMLAHMTKNMLEESNINAKELTWEEWDQMTDQAGAKFINDPTLFAALIGDRVAPIIAGRVDRVVAKLSFGVIQIFGIANYLMRYFLSYISIRPAFHKFMKQSVSSFLVFTAFEASKHLMEDAMFDLTKEEDERAREMFPLLWSLITNPKIENEFDRKLADKIVTNLLLIISNDDGRRDEWLYNTWRKGIFTGEFFAMIGTLTLGMQAGLSASNKLDSLMPIPKSLEKYRIVRLVKKLNPTKIIGSFFGILAGGAGMLVIPMSVTDGLTLSLHRVRSLMNKFSTDVNIYDYSKIGENTPYPPLYTHEAAYKRFNDSWAAREQFREQTIAATFDSLLLINERIFERQRHIETTQKAYQLKDNKIKGFIQRIGSEWTELEVWAKELHKDRSKESIIKDVVTGKYLVSTAWQFIADTFNPAVKPPEQIIYDHKAVIAQYKWLQTQLISGLLDYYDRELTILSRILNQKSTDFTRPQLEPRYLNMLAIYKYLTDIGNALDPSPEAFVGWDEFENNPEKFKEEALDWAYVELRNYGKKHFREKTFVPFAENFYSELLE